MVAFPSMLFAQNKVVVIPMAGNDVLPDPTSPLTKDSPEQSNYSVNGLFSVIDNVTGLEWQRLDENNTRTWADAFNYCLSLELDAKNDWRLPLFTELQSIVDYGSVSPAINSSVFPATDSSNYWTKSDSPQGGDNYWSVHFVNGTITPQEKPNLYYVRCVR